MEQRMTGVMETFRDGAVISVEIALYQNLTDFALQQTPVPMWLRATLQAVVGIGFGALAGAYTQPGTLARTAAVGLIGAGMVSGIRTSVDALVQAWAASRFLSSAEQAAAPPGAGAGLPMGNEGDFANVFPMRNRQTVPAARAA